MKLVSFQPQYLHRDEPLPFGIRDADGRLLLAAGQSIDNDDRMGELQRQPLFALEAESANWFKRLAAAMDTRIREGALLHQVVAARPDAQAAAAARKALPLAEEWHEILSQLDSMLREVRPGGDCRARLLAVHARARVLAARRTDASLYHLVYEASHSTLKYSSHHALLTMVIAEQSAQMLNWQQAWVDSLGRAALVMNVAMQRLQDQLAADERPPTAEARAEIEAHPVKGAWLLQQCGLSDELCLDTVRLHHDAGQPDAPLAALPPAQQLARLLRRVDIFSAQISLRRSRAPISPVQAAREACFLNGGAPDEVGGALLRAVGMYPPGSFVELACGEIGIVVARGRRTNVPYVAALLSTSGNLITDPLLRDTLDRRYTVKAAVPPAKVKIRPSHERLLALRTVAEPAIATMR